MKCQLQLVTFLHKMDSVHKFDEMHENCDRQQSVLSAQTANIKKRGNRTEQKAVQGSKLPLRCYVQMCTANSQQNITVNRYKAACFG